MLTAVLLLSLASSAPSADAGLPAPSPSEFASQWQALQLEGLPLPPLVRHTHVEAQLRRLKQAAPELFQVEVLGRSVEGRSLHHVQVGTGPRHVLLWSQMHGDEPTATTALLQVFEWLRTHRDDPVVTRLLGALTLHAVPLLNPDGAERFQRRNAQGIDINRDALALQTPEARALKELRDRVKPFIGFNLHNQSWRMAVGKTKKPASISLLAAAFDEARSDNPGRLLAKRVCAVIRDALEPLAAGQLGRYDDDFEVRAFGDNMTLWGTPSVLIETGPWPSREPDAELLRLNFVGLVSALDALASGRAEHADPRRYESLPLNNTSGLVFTLVRGVRLFAENGTPYVADVGVSATRAIRMKGKAPSVVFVGRIEELGDLRVLGAIEELEGDGLTAVPLPSSAIREGARVKLPKGPSAALRLGQPAEFMLLRPADKGLFQVEKIIRFER